MSDLPDPLVSSEVDLRDFAFTPIFRARLFGSTFHAHASDAGWRAGVTLWFKSWDQVPGGSLPENEIDLCRLAELGRDLKGWRKICLEALHGWSLHSDGRLYHKVVAQGVNEAWQRKIAQRDRTAKARAAKLNKPTSQDEKTSVTETVEDLVTEHVTGSKRQGQGHIERTVANATGDGSPSLAIVDDDFKPPELSAKEVIFGAALEWLSQKTGKPNKALRSLCGKWISDSNEETALKAIREASKQDLLEIIPYIEKVIAGHKEQADGKIGKTESESRESALERARQYGRPIAAA